jgi:drug/metabolite transporter (DMT)-like permease
VPRGRRVIGAIALSGVLNFTGYALIYAAETRLPGGIAAVVYGTLPLTTAVLVTATGVEKPRSSAILGALVSLAGIAVIFRDQLHVSAAQAGAVVMVYVSVVCSALYNLIFKKHVHDVHPLAMNAVFLSVTALGLGALAAAVERRVPAWPPTTNATLALLYLAIVGSVIAFASYFYLLARVSLMTASTLTLLIPVIALGVDALWESQRVAPLTYAGAGIVLAGVVLNLLGSRA